MLNMSRSIVIIIGPKGETLIEGVGFKGSSCEKATRYIEEALGTVWHRVKKPEYSQSRAVNHQQQVGA